MSLSVEVDPLPVPGASLARCVHAHSGRGAAALPAGEEAAQLVGMLEAVGRGDAAERLYCAARLPALQRAWEGYAAGTPFAAWLPGFYDQVGRC